MNTTTLKTSDRSHISPHDFLIAGADTDGLAFKKRDQKPFTKEEREALVNELNGVMGGFIRWEDDGVLKRQLVVKAKNYVMLDEKGKKKIKGSALKATTKEKALKRFISEIIDLILEDKWGALLPLYLSYAQNILKLSDISDWASKKTITATVLNGTGTAEVRTREAIGDMPVQEGDKVFMFFETPEKRCLVQNFKGAYDADILLGKLYDTISIFETILDIRLFPNLSLKRYSNILPR